MNSKSNSEELDIFGLGLALAALIGVALGLMGGGGSILTVPVFVYVLGFEAKEAIALSLAVVGGVFLIVPVLVLLAGLMMKEAVGTYLIRYTSQAGLRRAFAAFLVVMGSYILYRNRAVMVPEAVGGAPVEARAPAPNR